MAADTKQSSPNIGGNGFIWLLLAAAGTYFVAHQLPLEGSRPPTTEAIIGQRTGVQDVDARLWQDPFAAVAEVLARSPELKPENCQLDAIKDRIKGHCQSPLSESALGWQLPKPLLVMVAPVSGAPYSEQHESRRRTRYAILAGLNAEGFAPLDRIPRKNCSRLRPSRSSGSSPSQGVRACRTRAFCYFGSTKTP